MTEQTRRALTLGDAAQLMLFARERQQEAPGPPRAHVPTPEAAPPPAWLAEEMEPDPVCTSEFADHARRLHASSR